ncbi:MAG: hypothetical protein EOO09_00320 [Chitinophagaceae bacterium]|nr:MAG: hypothetical protein EOO09_00320 [Chitinophagaceae bacterium]
MMKAFNSLSIILVMALSIIGCRKERDLSYTGPAVLEFSNPLTGINTKTTGQSIGGASGIGGDENIPLRGDVDSVIIQLIGRQVTEAVTVNYTIAGGTAVAGVDYEIIGTTGQVVLQPNTSATSIKVRLLNTGTTVKSINFELSGSDKSDILPSQNLKTFVMNIFPMKAYLSRTIPVGGFFSSRTGLVYTAAEAAADPSNVDVAFVNNAGTPQVVAPSSVNPLLVASRFSARVFTPPANVIAAGLLQSYASIQLNAVTNATVAAIPVTGTTATAAVNATANIVADGIYGFAGAGGKKGFIRVKSVGTGELSIDVMTQP